MQLILRKSVSGVISNGITLFVTYSEVFGAILVVLFINIAEKGKLHLKKPIKIFINPPGANGNITEPPPSNTFHSAMSLIVESVRC